MYIEINNLIVLKFKSSNTYNNKNPFHALKHLQKYSQVAPVMLSSPWSSSTTSSIYIALEDCHLLLWRNVPHTLIKLCHRAKNIKLHKHKRKWKRRREANQQEINLSTWIDVLLFVFSLICSLLRFI